MIQIKPSSYAINRHPISLIGWPVSVNPKTTTEQCTQVISQLHRNTTTRLNPNLYRSDLNFQVTRLRLLGSGCLAQVTQLRSRVFQCFRRACHGSDLVPCVGSRCFTSSGSYHIPIRTLVSSDLAIERHLRVKTCHLLVRLLFQYRLDQYKRTRVGVSGHSIESQLSSASTSTDKEELNYFFTWGPQAIMFININE